MAMFPFWKVTPGGNPTILLKAQDFPRHRRAEVANAVMSPQHIGGEQVGFVRLKGTPRLDMMGGEFCLNATRAFASVLDSLGLLEYDGSISYGRVEVSGADSLIAVRVTHAENALPFVEACLHFDELPAPEEKDGIRLVRIPGITHIVQIGHMPDSRDLSDFCKAQRSAFALEEQEAVGHLWLSESEKNTEAGTSALVMEPAVWVRDTRSLCLESACGSGTLACALACHAHSGERQFSILQPSGTALSVRMEKADGGWDIWVGGPSRITASGETDLTGIA